MEIAKLMQGTKLQKEVVSESLENPEVMYREADRIYEKYNSWNYTVLWKNADRYVAETINCDFRDIEKSFVCMLNQVVIF